MNPAAEYYEQYLNSNTEHTEHTFEEAITALKAGKAIKRKDDATQSLRFCSRSGVCKNIFPFAPSVC